MSSSRVLPAILRAQFFAATHFVLALTLVASLATVCDAQPFGQQPQGVGQGNQFPGGNQFPQGNVFAGGNNVGLGPGLGGGSAQADFDSLIDLIQSTVEADTWMENGTGDGEIQPFPTGVYVDSGGALAFSSSSAASIALRRSPPEFSERSADQVHQESKLRFVSLPRLEAAVWNSQLEHKALPPAMLCLAGLQRIEYVLLEPETGDLIIAGPAGDWQIEESGRIVSTQTGRPVVRLDDLLTLWRRKQTHQAQAFGCSIIPRQRALAATQEYITETGKQPLAPSGRRDWLNGLRESLGKQDVEFFGLEPDSNVARVLLMADYHMKLIGMGIAKGVEGVDSYLSTVRLQADGTPPSMAVLRWWFAMHYEPVDVDQSRTTYRLRGQGVKVLSENELLAARGRRVHTGQSDELNRRFAESFTEHFEELAVVYPLYGELRNVFDLALLLSIVEREGLLERIGWRGELFASAEALKLPKLAVPAEVETVINHRVINRQHIIAGISGGVWLDAAKAAPIQSVSDTELDTPDPGNLPAAIEGEIIWWWD